MSQTINHNSDFLFLYEASQCNPNGDPDQENKPRMDYDTQTNIVTDVRVKRYIRDYFKQQGHKIFVDMEGDSKVSMDTKTKAVFLRLFEDDTQVAGLLDNQELFERYQKLKAGTPKETLTIFTDKKKYDKELNIALLQGLVRQKFIDVRMFGSAFAIEGFNKAMTGPIQLNWGYSLNKVYLMDSNTISSIMNDDSSTFGKDYRVKYSLLAFHGSINQYAAKTTGLKEEDLGLFRNAIWNGITSTPTRSKLNQYPKLYVEIVYNAGFQNGYFGDLRNLVETQVKDEGAPRTVRSFKDLSWDASRLINTLNESKGPDKPIKEVIIQHSPDLSFKL